MPAINSAVRHMPSIQVPEIDPRSAADHTANAEALLTRYREQVAALSRATADSWLFARDPGEPHRGLEHLMELRDNVQSYVDRFKLRAKKAWQLDPQGDFSIALARIERLRNDPKRIAARAAKAAARELAEAKRAEKYAADNAERIAKWRNGEPVGYGFYGLASALLRYNSADMKVETSQGAEVPATDAARAVRFIAKVRTKGAPWHRNGEQCPVGDFQIDEIEPTGNIRAGCHRIEWSEIEALGRTLEAHGIK